ncbi:MAG: hypothetical protein KJ757_05360 [Planctomycetes bacterium]|nr:hypothetical protein [Planctomycetota bacterium]MBU1518836.1 hypothetical protein [Planctomycetota bacterium]MBU2457207.1 hypothetical protein [Planctomycetota bacterium]MBU2596966.1 hypothetical protein [Planctomycetota bacterium]
MNPTDEAIKYLTTCCRNIGAFTGTGAPYAFLKNVASQIEQSKPSNVFPDRYKEHVAYAVDMVASNPFRSPPAAIASLYLATRFEYYFRILSGKLKGDGTWISKTAQDTAKAAINDKRLTKKQVSSLSLAYQIMMTDTSRQIVQQCDKIDNCLYQKPITLCNGTNVHNIGDRIEFGRLVVGHGHWGDISSEAVFYGLLTGIVFYNQT